MSKSQVEQVIGKCYDKYLRQVNKEKKIADVKDLVKQLHEQNIIEERLLREEVDYDAEHETACLSCAPGVDNGTLYTSGMAEIEDMVMEISGWARTKIELVVRTKEEFEHDDETRYKLRAEKLRRVGFEVHSWSEREESAVEGELEWIEAKLALMENETAEAILYVYVCGHL